MSAPRPAPPAGPRRPRRPGFRLWFPFRRREATADRLPPASPRRVRCAKPGCPNTVVDEWEESGLLCAECALEEELCDREVRWDRMYPGR